MDPINTIVETRTNSGRQANSSNAFTKIIRVRASQGNQAKKKWRVQTPAMEDAVETVGEVAEAKEVKAELQVGLSQGRHQRLGPVRNLKAIFSPHWLRKQGQGW
jgi:hypothetical protein